MKQVTKKFSALLMLLVLFTPASAQAASVSMEVIASSGSVVSGETFTATIRLNLGSNSTLDALANVTYDQSMLQYVSASYAPSSSWGSPGPEAGFKGSYYRVDVLTNSSAKSGTLDLVSITFKALASTGSTNIGLSDTSVSDGSVPPPAEHTVTTKAATVSFAAPAPAPSSPTPTSTPIAAPTQQEVEANADLDDDQPVPATNVSDEARYPVTVTVINQTGEPQAGVKVSFGEFEEVTTNENGIAEIDNVPAGTYEVKVNDQSQNVSVVTGDPAATQAFTLTLEATDRPWLSYLLIAGGLLALSVTLLLFVKWLRTRNDPAATTKNQIPAQNENEVDEYLRPQPPKAETVVEPRKDQE